MSKIKKKAFAFMPIGSSELGYSLLSLLLALSIFSLTLPFLSTLVININYQTNYNSLSMHHFFFIVREQLLHSRSYDVKNNKIYLQQLDDLITIEHYGSMIRRQVDGTGHEIFLRNVKDAIFQKLPYGIHVKITLTGGETYEKSLTYYK